MKKLILFITLILFCSIGFAQGGFSVTTYLGAVDNSDQITTYLDLTPWKTVDSVSVSLAVRNETDIDTVNFYRGIYTPNGSPISFVSDAAAGVLYQAVTLNVAASATDVEPLLTSNATVLSKAALRGFNGIKAVIEIAAAGNDEDDPNGVWITWVVHGTR